MVKIIISFTKIIITAAMAFLFASCQWNDNSIKGSGHVTTQTRTIAEDFTGVEANKGLDVFIEQSENKSVIVEADDNLASHITTKVVNGILKISSDYGNYHNVSAKKVTVRMPIINSLETNSAASLRTLNLIKSNDITIRSSSGSDIKVSVESDNIISESSSGSHITLDGKALKLETSASSGSGINAERLFANDVSAQTSSGSNTQVHAILSLEAKASSGSSINYNGSPKQVSKRASSGGSISQN